MSGNIRQKWLSTLIITALSLPTSLVLAPNSWSQEKAKSTKQESIKSFRIEENLDTIKTLSEEADGGQERATSESVSEKLSLYLRRC